LFHVYCKTFRAGVLPSFPLQAKERLTDVIHLQNTSHVLALDVPD